jgi:hypothetical protein
MFRVASENNFDTYTDMVNEFIRKFNSIVPSKLITKLRTLGLNTSLCNWILDLLTGRPQVVSVGKLHILGPLLYSLFTHDCMAKHDSNTIIKFADDTTVVGLFTDNDETYYINYLD